MFICDMVLRYTGTLKPGQLKSGPVIADMTTTVVHRDKLLIKDAKLFTHSLLPSC